MSGRSAKRQRRKIRKQLADKLDGMEIQAHVKTWFRLWCLLCWILAKLGIYTVSDETMRAVAKRGIRRELVG